MKKILIALLALSLLGCGSGSSSSSDTEEEIDVDSSTLALLSSFVSNPSSNFLVDIENVTNASPFVGSNNADPHDGAHVHFQNTGGIPEGSSVEDYPAIYAVADGTISYVDSYRENGDNYKYAIDLAFAQDDDETVSFEYSIEPMTDPGNESFYEAFIFVEVGDEVSAGDMIARMYVPVTAVDNGTHIHFSLTSEGSKQAPVIFTSEIEDGFIELTGGECMGEDLTADENPQGSGAMDCL